MQNSEMSAGTNAEQLTEGEVLKSSKTIAKPNVNGSLRVVDISYGGSTGIHDYFISDGRIITCRPDELDALVNCH